MMTQVARRKADVLRACLQIIFSHLFPLHSRASPLTPCLDVDSYVIPPYVIRTRLVRVGLDVQRLARGAAGLAAAEVLAERRLAARLAALLQSLLRLLDVLSLQPRASFVSENLLVVFRNRQTTVEGEMRWVLPCRPTP